MPQIDNAPRKPNDDELPGNEDALIHIDNLKHDHLNVRNVEPSADLIKNISLHGFVEPIITWEDKENKGEYFITDGWQRYQSAQEVGFTHIPVQICKNKDEATQKAGAHSLGKEWGDLEDYNQDFIRIQKVHIEENGLSKKEAVEKRTNERQVTKGTIKKNYEIAQLPKRTKQLLREPSKRPDGFHDERDVDSCITKSDGTLNKKNAYIIAKRYNNDDLTDNESFNFALRATRNSDVKILKEALKKHTYEDMFVKDAFDEAKDEVTTEQTKDTFNVGIVNLSQEEKNLLSRHIRHEYNQSVGQYFNQLVKEKKDDMLNNINKKKYSNNQWAIQDSRDKAK